MCKLDFSEFHPLDHWCFTRDCAGWHGGWINHIKLWWEYQAPDPVGRLMCLAGFHDITPYWHYGKGEDPTKDKPPSGEWCRRCWYEEEDL